MITPFGRMNELFSRVEDKLSRADTKFKQLASLPEEKDPFKRISSFEEEIERKIEKPFTPKAKAREQLRENISQLLSSNPSVGALFKGLSPVLDSLTDPSKFDSIIKAAAEKFNLDPDLIKAVIRQESNFNPNAVSKAGAMGLMQLMPETAKWLGVTNPFDPVQNIFGGAKYLRMLLDKFNGNLELALAAYNAGPANVEKHKGIPPFKETQDYVRNILYFYNSLKNKGV